jgi:hypothetical protein
MNPEGSLPRWLRRVGGASALSLVALAAALAPLPAQAAHWVYGWHAGAYGWWWVDLGIWTWYGNDPYRPYGYNSPPPGYRAAPAQPARPPVYYYCDAAGGYYPQVPSCPAGWRQVPATPAPGAAGAAPAAPGTPPPPPSYSAPPPAAQAPGAAPVAPDANPPAVSTPVAPPAPGAPTGPTT